MSSTAYGGDDASRESITLRAVGHPASFFDEPPSITRCFGVGAAFGKGVAAVQAVLKVQDSSLCQVAAHLLSFSTHSRTLACLPARLFGAAAYYTGLPDRLHLRAFTSSSPLAATTTTVIVLSCSMAEQAATAAASSTTTAAVTGAARRPSSPVASLSRPVTPPTSATIRVSPSEFSFQASKANPHVLVGRVSLRIVAADAPIGFKFKTNAPDRYSIRPVLGVLSPSGESVEIFARCEGAVQPDDRFMIESIALTEEEARQLDSKKQWKHFDRRRIVENFIHCRVPHHLHSRQGSVSSFHTANLAPPTVTTATTATAPRSTSASPRLRSQRTHSRMPSLELPVSRRATTATAGTQHGTGSSTTPVHRPLVVGSRVSSTTYYGSGGSDVEVGLEPDEEKRDRKGSTTSMAGMMVAGRARACVVPGRPPIDKGLVDLLPQLLLFLLACVIVAFWMPILRWLSALFWLLFGSSTAALAPPGYLRDSPLAADNYEGNAMHPPAGAGNPFVVAHA
ncbi:hypothetical protein SYNPS1DRAFT_28714 [Syncephalis pseudoplumigaleata]|uniref:MSP domain-containing protein n=1 Tax=Syncephalis pseudoplumigaleata TaxID=1712513 RepID=A0A4P9YZW6_9FUNG|nr:hypothetical protein SYNPS1DRAFT_28714 [Syncephalis pseudoplumigaleata]|eukprot:RKP25558.1 hypothetical protein SYNPS1DRAFT_28714 [Syncephalis pseudoplumigaleata]